MKSQGHEAGSNNGNGNGLYRVILSGGRVLEPCMSRGGAEAYAQTWNALSPGGENQRAEAQPLEESLIHELFRERPIAHT